MFGTDKLISLSLALGAVIGLVVLSRFLLRLRRRLVSGPGAPSEEGVCQRCGYDLRGLEIPRCPECGALRGFRVPLEQLGLTEEEVRRGSDRRRHDPSERDEA